MILARLIHLLVLHELSNLDKQRVEQARRSEKESAVCAERIQIATTVAF